MEKSLHTFSQMGFPVSATVLLMLVESVGAVLLVAGFLTRIWALGIGAATAVCMLKSNVQYGFFMNWFNQQKGEVYEYHILVLGIALALLIRCGACSPWTGPHDNGEQAVTHSLIHSRGLAYSFRSGPMGRAGHAPHL